MASYIPPLRFHVLTRFYDRVVRATTRERAFKRALVAQVRARPGDDFHVADWGRPGNILLRGAFLLVQLLDGFENTRDSVCGALPRFIEQAGFRDVRETRRFATLLGTISLYRAA